MDNNSTQKAMVPPQIHTQNIFPIYFHFFFLSLPLLLALPSVLNELVDQHTQTNTLVLFATKIYIPHIYTNTRKCKQRDRASGREKESYAQSLANVHLRRSLKQFDTIHTALQLYSAHLQD